MTTRHDRRPSAPPPGPRDEDYVSRDVCEAFRREQRDAHNRTWEELRGLRRLVVLLIVGGQLFSGGLNVAGFGYWIDRHAAQPHPSTLKMIAEARAQSREDLRDLRREIRDLVVSVLKRIPDRPSAPDPPKGDRP